MEKPRGFSAQDNQFASNQYASLATWIWKMNDVSVAFGLLSLHTV